MTRGQYSIPAVLLQLLCGFVVASAAHAQTPPDPPVIIDPPFDGEIAAASDVHMETNTMSDDDPGDTHFCTDWEIWSVTPAALAWASLCVSTAAKTHIHLGDGQFLNAHAQRTELFADTNYRLQVRFQDQTGLWSNWSQRLFTTGPASGIFPMELDDIATFPAPRWENDEGLPITCQVVLHQASCASSPELASCCSNLPARTRSATPS
jgi:hypothetical protein